MIERVGLCAVDGCPAPSSPEWHVPWCGHGLAGSHHHVVKRSQGGVDGWVVFICPRCHDDIDNGYTLEDAVLDFPALNEQRYYIYRDIGDKREYLCERTVYPPFWEGNVVGDGLGDIDPPVPSRKALSGREPTSSATILTYSQWSEKVHSIGAIRHSMGFLIGDLVILGEDAFGEKAWQLLSELGYEDRSIGNMVRVCRAIPPPRRRENLSYSYHVVVYTLPQAVQDEWLGQAETHDWTVREFREAVHGPRVPPVYTCPECGRTGEIGEFRTPQHES